MPKVFIITKTDDANVLKMRESDIVTALVKGISKQAKVEYNHTSIPVPVREMTKLYSVQVGTFSSKTNAEALLQNLKKAGFNGFIIEAELEKPSVPEIIVKPLTEYYETSKLKVIETIPSNAYVAALPGKTLRQFGIYGINGTWQDTPNAANSSSIWGLAGNNNKPIGPNSHQNSPKGYKRGTIVYSEDGTIEIKRINNLKELSKPFKWCIGGGSLIPYYNPAEEQIAEDILRITAHTGIGYKKDRIMLFVTDSHCSMLEFRTRVLGLGLDGAIFLDGGGSSQLNYKDGKGLYSSRPLSHGVFIKEV